MPITVSKIMPKYSYWQGATVIGTRRIVLQLQLCICSSNHYDLYTI